MTISPANLIRPIILLAFTMGSLPAASQVLWQGRPFEPLGSATVALDPTGDAIVVDNIGSSGQDGFSLRFGGDEGGGFALQAPALPPVPGSTLSQTTRFEDAAGSQLAFTVIFEFKQSGGIEVRPDPGNSGSPHYDLRLLDANGGVLYEARGITGPVGTLDRLPVRFETAVADTAKPKKKGNIEYNWKVEEGESKSAALQLTLPDGSIHSCHEILLRKSPPSNLQPFYKVHAVDVRMSGPGPLVVEDAWLRAFGRRHRGTGGAAVDLVQNGGPAEPWTIAVSNIGSSGQDGVTAEVPVDGSGHFFDWCSPSDMDDVYREMTLTGAVFGTPGVLARSWARGFAGLIELAVEFPLLPGPVVVRYGGADGLVEIPWDGSPLFSSGSPAGMRHETGSLDDGVISSFIWTQTTQLDLPDGTVAAVTYLEFAPATPVAIDILDSVGLSLDGTGAAVPVCLTSGSAERRSDGVVVATVGAARARDRLINWLDTDSDGDDIDNIGSSGQDGISYRLAAPSDYVGIQFPPFVVQADSNPQPLVYYTILMERVRISKTFGQPMRPVLEMVPVGGLLEARPAFEDPGAEVRMRAYFGGGLVADETQPAGGAWQLDRNPVLFAATTSDTASILVVRGPFIVYTGLEKAAVQADEIRFEAVGATVGDGPWTGITALFARPAGGDDKMATRLILTSPVADVGDLPLRTAIDLEQNYPNPFNPVTTIAFTLDRASRTELVIYDIAGRVVRRLLDGVLPAGRQTIAWDGRDGAGHQVASGMYLYRIATPAGSAVRPMVLIK